MPTLPYVYKVTKYNPVDWNDAGRYIGPEDETSDHGPKEAAYLAAVRAFAEESGIIELSVREPGVSGFVNFGLEENIEGHGLAGLFAPDLSDYYDGALVSVDVGVELVRGMLRDAGAWCKLEVEDRFLVHIGYDQYMYIGSAISCERALATAAGLGLFPVRIEKSPWAEGDDSPGRPADEAFWAEVTELATQHGTVLLCEVAARSMSRWHRLEPATVETTRALLAPRAMLSVWPELSADVKAVQAKADNLCDYVWEDQTGDIQSVTLTDPEPGDFPEGAVAAAVISGYQDVDNPLLKGVLLDSDGVLRARWGA